MLDDFRSVLFALVACALAGSPASAINLSFDYTCDTNDLFPEPATAILLAMGSFVIVSRRRCV